MITLSLKPQEVYKIPDNSKSSHQHDDSQQEIYLLIQVLEK
ncbi:9008_t:CDS:2, partial [Gigaspora margarita]